MAGKMWRWGTMGAFSEADMVDALSSGARIFGVQSNMPIMSCEAARPAPAEMYSFASAAAAQRT